MENASIGQSAENLVTGGMRRLPEELLKRGPPSESSRELTASPTVSQ
jgi:hypothetical protein